MTEAEWMACKDPTPMLVFLVDKACNRKFRLFACSCCRRLWPVFDDDRTRLAVEIAEQVADGKKPRQALFDAVEAAGEADSDGMDAASAVLPLAHENAYDAALEVSNAEDLLYDTFLDAVYYGWANGDYTFRRDPTRYDGEQGTNAKEKIEAERVAQVSLLRDIFGNPFRSPRLDSTWLAWNGGTIRSLAQAIYDDRAFDRMPILADALEDAGCTDADILGHCRGEGPHVRGCWVVDLLLSRS
jgi:hypothetical protein